MASRWREAEVTGGPSLDMLAVQEQHLTPLHVSIDVLRLGLRVCLTRSSQAHICPIINYSIPTSYSWLFHAVQASNSSPPTIYSLRKLELMSFHCPVAEPNLNQTRYPSSVYVVYSCGMS